MKSTVPDIIKGIEQLGYKVIDDPALHVPKFYEKVENKFIFCLTFTVPLLLHMVLPWHFCSRPYGAIDAYVSRFCCGVPAFW